jgi:hypothetical protein
MERSSFGINWTYDYYIDTIFYGQLDSLINNGQIDTVISNNDLYNGRLINLIVDTLANYAKRRKLVVGCGLAEEHYYFFNSPGYNNEELIYFKKGNEEWGTPMYFYVGDVDLRIQSVNVFPNPFATSTTLSFRLCKPENLHFTVYNLQSQIVYTMEERRNKGRQEIQWNAEGLPAGMYYYRIQAGDMVGGGKMVKISDI